MCRRNRRGSSHKNSTNAGHFTSLFSVFTLPPRYLMCESGSGCECRWVSGVWVWMSMKASVGVRVGGDVNIILIPNPHIHIQQPISRSYRCTCTNAMRSRGSEATKWRGESTCCFAMLNIVEPVPFNSINSGISSLQYHKLHLILSSSI
jgi:hypothetical protein